MRVLYGYKKKPDANKYVVIYDRHHNVGDAIKMKNYIIISEREVTSFESDSIVLPMKKAYRVYHYDSIDNLVDDELRSLIITPLEVIENFKTNEL